MFLSCMKIHCLSILTLRIISFGLYSLKYMFGSYDGNLTPHGNKTCNCAENNNNAVYDNDGHDNNESYNVKNKSIQRIYNTFEKSPTPFSLSISSSSSSSPCSCSFTSFSLGKKKEFCLVLSLLAMN